MIQLGEVFKKHKLIIAVGCLAVIAVLSALFLTAQPEVPDPGSTGNSKPITLEDYEAIEIGAAKETIREKFGEPHTYGNWGYDEIYVLLDGQVTISYDSDGETDTFVEDVSINTHARLSLNDVIMLSEKGEDLTWTDFEQFPYIEGGSGVYIRDYHINDLFCFSIGGGLTDDEPFYMTLYTKAGTDDSIDIRTENVTEFISKHGMGVGDWGVTLTATDVTPTGMTLTLAWDGEEDVTGTLMTGAWFAIDVLEDDAWTEVYAPRADWTEEAYDLPTTQKIDWEWLYGTLPSGIYRIEKEVLNIREPGDFDRLIYTAEFEVPEEIVGDPRLLTAEELTYFNDNYFDILYDQEDYYVRFSEGTRMGDTVTLTFRGYEPDTGDVHEMIAESLTLEQVDDKYIFVSRDYAA